MLVTIRVHNVRVLDGNNVEQAPHLRAIGYLPGGQVLIQGRILAGHSPSVQGDAVSEVAAWLRRHRPGWDIASLPGEGVVGHCNGSLVDCHAASVREARAKEQP